MYPGGVHTGDWYPDSAILWRQLLKRYYVIIMIYTEAVLGQTCPFSVILPFFVFTSK
jgi:hypothetical protein